MSLEWLLVALPVVFVLGWFAARLDIHHIRKSVSALPRAYVRGLRELLNGNESKALDAFSDLARIDTLPPDLQFTVGKLSRRRGDYRRAIKTHQQLQENERLSAEDRNRAIWELAHDYNAMGFMDAAEAHARQLKDIPDYINPVFDFLLNNYQKRHRYRDALTLIDNATPDVRQTQRITASHLYCELAQAQDATLYEKALAINPVCARARLELAATLKTAPALEHYQAIAEETPQYLWLAAKRLLQEETNNDTIQETLNRWLAAHGAPMLYKTIVSATEARLAAAPETQHAAIKKYLNDVIENFLFHHRNVEAAAYFFQHSDSNSSTVTQLAVLEALLNARDKAFVCGNCVYKTNYFTWQCPCCLRWESFEQQ